MADRETTATDLCELFAIIESLGIRVWLDGGWAVDAWLGQQTRRHADVDIVIETKALGTLVQALRARGYDDVLRDDTRAWNFVLGDADGHEVDFHVIDLAPDGTGTYGPPPPEFIFPADSLTASTELCGRPVFAIPPHGSWSSTRVTSRMTTTGRMSSRCATGSASPSRPSIEPLDM